MTPGGTDTVGTRSWLGPVTVAAFGAELMMVLNKKNTNQKEKKKFAAKILTQCSYLPHIGA